MEKPLGDKKKQKLIDKALMTELAINKEELKKLKKKLIKVESKPERGIETWFRLSSKNLYTRLQIIDTKSNILITTNAIIISVVIGTLYPRLSEDPFVMYAVGTLIFTNVLSITFAILATIPKATRGSKGKDLTELDLMTFDDFYDTKLEDYRNAVIKTLEERKTLYPSIITDIHKLGVTLAKKYKLIRISYIIFLCGIIISLFTFGLCHCIFQ